VAWRCKTQDSSAFPIRFQTSLTRWNDISAICGQFHRDPRNITMDGSTSSKVYRWMSEYGASMERWHRWEVHQNCGEIQKKQQYEVFTCRFCLLCGGTENPLPNWKLGKNSRWTLRIALIMLLFPMLLSQSMQWKILHLCYVLSSFSNN
jgi:hypothetical protein